ncbi:MAG: hypothetical protein Kow0080_10150 [Candidatus Promineifilaceae bacterium]
MTTNIPKQQNHPGGTQPLAETTPQLLIAGRYQVVNQFTGGMGIVYLCRDKETNEAVALKTFKPEYLSHRTARDLFLREGTMWVELGYHPNIVNAYRVERIGDGREVYLVLEWVVQPKGKSNPSLRAWLKPGQPIQVDLAVLFALHVARGMRYATNVMPGLVHRDIKPENILISHDLVAKVTDFGLASTLSQMMVEDKRMSTRENLGRTQLTQGVVGTPLYMAPEQWLHKSLDSRADIYALGCILYEMVVGHFAAIADDKEELKEIHLNGRIKPPPKSIPREVTAFLRKCLATDRERRYLNWNDVLQALETVYTAVTGQQPPPERTGREDSPEERLALGRSYNTMGLSYLDIGKLDVAIMYFEQAVWIGRNEQARDLECAGLGNLGKAYTAQGYLERAIEFHEEQLAIAREIGLMKEESEALSSLGNAYLHLGDTNRAIAYHQQGLQLAQRISDRFREAAALDNLGRTHYHIGEVETAVSMYQHSLAIARDIGDQTRVKSILNNMGRVYLQSGNAKEAAVLFQQALDISRKMGDHLGEGQTLDNLGRLYRVVGKPDRAIEFFERALAIYQEINDRRRVSSVHFNLGDLFMESDRVEEALTHYESALFHTELLRDEKRELEALYKLGDAILKTGDVMQAASFYKRALDKASALHNHDAERMLLPRLAEAYGKWGDTGRAVNYYEEAQRLYQNVDDLQGEMQVLRAMGKLAQKIRQYKLARTRYEQYLAIAQKADDWQKIGDAWNCLGDVWIVLGDEKAALDAYKSANEAAVKTGDKQAEVVALINLSHAYHLQGKKRPSVKSIDKAVALAARLKNEDLLRAAVYQQAKLAFQHGKWDKTIHAAQKALKLFAKYPNEEGRIQELETILKEAEANQQRGWTSFLSSG